MNRIYQFISFMLIALAPVLFAKQLNAQTEVQKELEQERHEVYRGFDQDEAEYEKDIAPPKPGEGEDYYFHDHPETHEMQE